MRYQLKIPVALFVFNRPEETRRVFAEIEKAKPPKLFIVGDGPRTAKTDDAEKVAAVREIVSKINWNCEVLTNFSDVNLGCKLRVASGIDWVFSQVEEVIFLEDDCLPDPTFFQFCEELLNYYKEDLRVSQICGVNLQDRNLGNGDSYHFSYINNIWGWASWRNRWINVYDMNLSSWPSIKESGLLQDWVSSRHEYKYWSNNFEQAYQGAVNTWDFQWVFANLLNSRLSIMPSHNLIKNIGFGSDATHTTADGALSNLPVSKMLFPLIHPNSMYRRYSAERDLVAKVSYVPLQHRIYQFLIRLTRMGRKK